MNHNPYSTRIKLPPSEPLAGRPLHVLAHLHKYPPTHNAGAEWMLHEMMKWLLSRGHRVQVTARDYDGEPYDLEGVRVERGLPDSSMGVHYAWADIVLTHLDVTRNAIDWARNARKPLVHVIHNHKQLDYHRVVPNNAQLIIHNSEWTERLHPLWDGDSIVVRPPVWAKDYDTRGQGDHDAVTLLNMNEQKGGRLFWALAESMSKHKFLGVRGAYGHQEMGGYDNGWPSNVMLWKNNPHILEAYKHTRVLLVPSAYESWGRVAVEAIASGIPVIANPTPGLLESMGDAALFVDLDQTEKWREAITALDDPDVYAFWSEKALKRSKELDPTADLLGFEKALLDIADPERKTKRMSETEINSITGVVKYDDPEAPVDENEFIYKPPPKAVVRRTLDLQERKRRTSVAHGKR